MNTYQLSFAKINILSDNIAELIIDQNAEVSLEMCQESDDLLSQVFSNDFAVLVNKINQYNLSFETKLSMGSHPNLKAIAVVTYNQDCKKASQTVSAIRQLDGWNQKEFDGLNLGWQEGLDWLQSELTTKD